MGALAARTAAQALRPRATQAVRRMGSSEEHAAGKSSILSCVTAGRLQPATAPWQRIHWGEQPLSAYARGMACLGLTCREVVKK